MARDAPPSASSAPLRAADSGVCAPCGLQRRQPSLTRRVIDRVRPSLWAAFVFGRRHPWISSRWSRPPLPICPNSSSAWATCAGRDSPSRAAARAGTASRGIGWCSDGSQPRPHRPHARALRRARVRLLAVVAVTDFERELRRAFYDPEVCVADDNEACIATPSIICAHTHTCPLLREATCSTSPQSSSPSAASSPGAVSATSSALLSS